MVRAQEHRGDGAAGREMYLIDGRRVTVSDLLNAGLIAAGARLRFARSRVDDDHHATVTEGGRIRLEPGGEEFRSPSGAATTAAGIRAVDGWRAWQVVDQGRLLDAVRQELLDRVATGMDRPARGDGQDAGTANRSVHERLRRARERADSDKPEHIAVRELLGLWGTQERGDQVSRIEADLANHGLVTSPSFRAVTLDTVVSLTTPPDLPDDDAPTPPPPVGDLPVDEDDEGEHDLNVRLTVGNLSALDGIVSVRPDSTFDEAITKMCLNDYAQLGVLSGERNLRGAVTWRSIAQALHQKPGARFAEAIDPRVEVVPYDRDLVEVLPVLQQRDFVFVADQTRAVKGIVTTADVAQRYGAMATPFFQVGELDQTLRWILSRALDLATIQRLCGRKVTGVDELTLGDSQHVLENEEGWAALRWPLNRKAFIERLADIRRIRNKVMHFHPDPVPEDAVDKLRRFNDLLHSYRERS